MSEPTFDIEMMRTRLLDAIRDYIEDPTTFNDVYLLGCKHMAEWIFGDTHMRDIVHTADRLLFPER